MSAGKAKGHGPPRRKHHDDEHDEAHADERWLVTYADMVTLLMVLFIVMFAMSTVDERKYAQLKDGLAEGFGREQSILTGASPVSNAKGVGDPGEASYEMLLAQVPESQRENVTKILDEAARLKNERAQGAARAEVDRLLKVWKRIDEALRHQGLRDDVRATIDERGLVVSLVSQHVVFEPDIAELTERGRRVVDTIAPVLADLTEPIELDGHTNQEPVKPRYYPSDWELSLARAANVLHRLEDSHGIRARRLRATGFGHTKPLVDPARHGSQRVNKRVDILVLSQQPAETRALMGQAYDELRREAGLDGLPTDPAGDGTASGPHAAAGVPTRSRGEDPS
ncbi:flagellar motor protein MotB [Nocardioides albidus]|uniref:Flagellar motor protein MotB n=1 Tax=Nocardioides albidus TaxID=1517589 RepID=A0A5C4W7C5_9ACTN|nr:flagellar motor protein MotB [Nocardioides albidus]TNM44194.1 flagellar motor protein MotB [Nocardioides albidus]